ncbi:MAG: hypothetical protein ACK58J_14085, partial [Planctomyces sp.]
MTFELVTLPFRSTSRVTCPVFGLIRVRMDIWAEDSSIFGDASSSASSSAVFPSVSTRSYFWGAL